MPTSAIHFAAVPTGTRGEGRASLDALTACLTELLGQRVSGIEMPSYAGLLHGLAGGSVHFAWMPPALLVLAEERVEVEPLVAAVRGDRLAYRAVLFVDAATQYQHTEELTGGTVAWVDPTSASGYLHPRIQLAARGIDTTNLFRAEAFLGSHRAVAQAVFDGRADVGATFAEWPGDGQPVTRAGFLDVDPNANVRVIEWTGPIPNDLIVAHGNIDPELRDRFARALLSMSTVGAGRKVLNDLFHAHQFLWAPKEAFDPLRKLVLQARQHHLLPSI